MNQEPYFSELARLRKTFPEEVQQTLIVQLLQQWSDSRGKKQVVSCTYLDSQPAPPIQIGWFGILTQDWPGLSNACIGVFHEMGWNIDFVVAFQFPQDEISLGIALIAIKLPTENELQAFQVQKDIIQKKLEHAAIGTGAKVYLLREEIRKLEIYSEVIAWIESHYQKEDLEAITGPNGEAVKYFAARSRDYIENRSIEEIARQILRNHTFIKTVRESGPHIQLDISNMPTKTEGIFTTVTLAGPAQMLHLEDCLKTIELTFPHFILKHNREFTTKEGISVYRIEFVDSRGMPIPESEHEKLRNAFKTLVLNKQRERAQWIETIGGFEHYARAIIPLLVREAQHSNKIQVYQSVFQTTELFIDFKVIVAIPNPVEQCRRLITQLVRAFEAVEGLKTFGLRPPKSFENTEVFIIDLRADLSVLENVETIYKHVKTSIRKILGDFRDFDEGMRTLDAEKFRSVCRMMNGIDKSLIREIYYSIEDFFRVSASIEEITAHIRLAVDMLLCLEKSSQPLQVLTHQVYSRTLNGKEIPKSSLLCIAYSLKTGILEKIIELLENYEIVLSRLERPSANILICRITDKEKALPDEKLEALAKQIQNLAKQIADVYPSQKE